MGQIDIRIFCSINHHRQIDTLPVQFKFLIIVGSGVFIASNCFKMQFCFTSSYLTTKTATHQPYLAVCISFQAIK